MKTQIARSLSAAALAITLLTGSTSAFAATPGATPAFYGEETETTADALEVGATGLAVGAVVVDAAAGNTSEGRAVAGGLAVGAVGTGLVAAPIVRRAGR
jgi:hypothetical protein